MAIGRRPLRPYIILHQHDRGNVLGHFLSGLGSRVGRVRQEWVRQPVGQGSFHHKKASTTDCSSTVLRVNFLTPLQVRGQGSNQI